MTSEASAFKLHGRKSVGNAGLGGRITEFPRISAELGYPKIEARAMLFVV
jgi:hypothetical protein